MGKTLDHIAELEQRLDATSWVCKQQIEELEKLERQPTREELQAALAELREALGTNLKVTDALADRIEQAEAALAEAETQLALKGEECERLRTFVMESTLDTARKETNLEAEVAKLREENERLRYSYDEGLAVYRSRCHTLRELLREVRKQWKGPCLFCKAFQCHEDYCAPDCRLTAALKEK